MVAQTVTARKATGGQFFTALADDEKHTGKIVSAAEGKLTMTTRGNQQRQFEVNDQTKITLNGQRAKLEDLKAGYTATVTCEKEGDKLVAKTIAARKAKGEQFLVALADETLRGKIVSVAEGTLSMTTTGDEQKRVVVNSKTQITVNGRPAKLKDLKAGQECTVTARKDGDKLVATKIAARKRDE